MELNVKRHYATSSLVQEHQQFERPWCCETVLKALYNYSAAHTSTVSHRYWTLTRAHWQPNSPQMVCLPRLATYERTRTLLERSSQTRPCTLPNLMLRSVSWGEVLPDLAVTQTFLELFLSI